MTQALRHRQADRDTGFSGPSSAAGSGQSASRLRLALLVAVLPLFGQTFHYLKDVPPLWALSKAFPVLSLPLAALLLARLPLPRDVHYWLGAFVWLLLVSSIAAIFAFDQSFFLGLTAQVKLLGMLHALSFLGLLVVLRPTLDELSRGFAIWAAIIAALLALLWAFAPQGWYATGYDFGDAPLLSVDDRGNRIRMPMQFVLIGVFLLYRRFLAHRRWQDLAGVAVGLALAVFVVKTRAFVVASAATLVAVSVLAASAKVRIAAVCLAAIAALLLLQVPYMRSMLDIGASAGFDLRWTTVQKASGFLGDDLGRWVFGVGTITPLDRDGLAQFFNHFFFLADISWLGIVFEFGLVGAGILFALLVRTWWLGRQVRRQIDAPFLGALQDYVLFVLLVSPLYSTMTLQPGEVAMIAAIFIYATMLGRGGNGRHTATGAGL